ncbi:MAG TPA: S8 family serine peptidase, partial [Jiangellaceae bacterium]
MQSRLSRLGTVAASTVLVVTAVSAASAQPASDLVVGADLPAPSRIQADKAPSSALAQTDPALLKRNDSAPAQVVIKLDYDAAASYAGGIAGLPATSPSVTGKPLTGKSSAERSYNAHVTALEQEVVSEIEDAVPEAKVDGSLRVVYGGIAAVIPANEVETILEIPGVVAVQQDSLRQLVTDSSPEFIGAPTIYGNLGTTANAGEGIIYGNLDSGVWPEHPSFADLGNLPEPPPKADGTPRACNFGDNPLTPAPDPFACNDKLIGGQPFLATYLSNPDRAAAEPYHTARDSNGHGTHTSSTTAGNMLGSAQVLGVDRGAIHGIAPGAHLIEYKVCGIEGCFSSDSAAAVQQAILDGVDVINFSISGGEDPFNDPVELAFLDAYAAGVFVSASAGNDGPGAGTVNHLSPWVTTVAASTQTREFATTLSLTASDGATFTVDGASITAGAGPAPVVLSSAAPYNNPLCDVPAPAGIFTGKIVACQRGVVGRVEKGFNVLQGGAVGMVLYNPNLADVETDNHWLPTVHLADGTDFVAFMAGNTGVTGSFPAGEKRDGQGDVMAAFSSRGPGGLFVKPDVTAPGVQILAGHTPTPESILEGPPGQYFQAIAGTSMSSPHTAGAAILVRAVHPDWTPGQVKSALMTTALQDVVKEDLTTPADPFDFGSGRIDLTVAGSPALTFDETAADFFALGNDPLSAVHLNIPSINAPLLPGRLV